MKQYFKKSIILLTSFFALSSYSSLEDLEGIAPEIKRKVGALVKTAQEVSFFSRIPFNHVNFQTCKSAQYTFHQAIKSLDTLWWSTTLFGGEMEGGLQALSNRVDRFKREEKLQKKTINLHMNIVISFLDSLARLRKTNQKGWHWILNNPAYHATLTIFKSHIDALQHPEDFFISNQSMKDEIRAKIGEVNAILERERIKHPSIL